MNIKQSAQHSCKKIRVSGNVPAVIVFSSLCGESTTQRAVGKLEVVSK